MACDYIREEEDSFFDFTDDLSTMFKSSAGCPATSHASFREEKPVKWTTSDPLFHVWTESPGSIQERRSRFMQLMGLDPVRTTHPDSIIINDELMVDNHFTGEFDRIFSDSGAVLRNPESDNRSLLSMSDDVLSSSQVQTSIEQFERRYKDLEDASVIGECKSNYKSSLGRPQMDVRSFTYGRHPMWEDDSSSTKTSEKVLRLKSFRWLRKLGILTCIAGSENYKYDAGAMNPDASARARLQKIQVQAHHKQSKEFSAVYVTQNFKAHHGVILTMKFSPDGEFLATGGQDGVVRIWQVLECARACEDEIPDVDPSCIYFRARNLSEPAHFYADNAKMAGSKNLRRTTGSTFVVVPPEGFHIAEKPLYEFHGHKGDVLDLAWSNNQCVLSSSVDKTVRMWRLGCDSCLNVFAHNNYVTCVQFSPINEEYFISGSIDGKVRIWRIPTCRVVDWIDINEIVTAVCYHPDGKVVVVGSMEGDCCFYDASDNHLQLDTRVSFDGKKKTDKRITGLQFCPSNCRKLIVTSGNSVIRILEGVDVISKYKGLRNAGSHISATFTDDGRHIVSASEDSKVYIWRHSNDDHHALTPSSNLKTTSSSEHFASHSVSIAIPWQGMSKRKTLSLSPPTSFTPSPEFFVDVLHRGSATWPEEKLPSTVSKTSNFDKPQLKFLKSSFQRRTSHSWGRVIVTAGWDGRIRSFQNYGLPTQL